MLRPGDIVERYEIVELLGKGGMGEVYRAHDKRLQRDVALKILRAAATATGSDGSDGATIGGARMLREARAVALLEHPNVVAVYDVGEVEKPEELKGMTYLAMELVKGRPLREFLGENWSIPIAQRIRWLTDAARALAAAHARGLVHRDVKPENIMIREDGVVKVLDFGIAKRTHTSLDPTASTGQGQILPTLSTQGFIVGTPHYMAPEQMRGETIDGRADQFSWGVVAYELLCNRVPWHPEGGDTLQLVAQVLTMDAEPLVLQNPEVPPPIAAVVMRALHKARGERFASMDDLVAALEGKAAPSAAPSGAGEASTAPPPKRSDAAPGLRRAAAWIAAGAVAAAILAAVTLRSSPKPAPNGTPAPAGSSAADPARCTSSRACSDAHSGAAYRCRRDDGRCVALASPDCKVFADARDLENDDTVWFGSLYPLTGPDAAAFGIVEAQAVELARQDFAQTMGSFAATKQGTVHPLGLVSCDDAADAARAARHLDDVGVPGVIGFRSSAEAVELATTTFLPKGVMTVVALNTSSQIASIPQPLGPRLVWRTTYNISETAVPLSVLVSTVLEPRLKAAGVPGPVRVALVRPKNAGALGFSSKLFDTLAFNGKTALENGSDYRELVWNDGENQAESLAEVATGLGAFAPHIIVFQGDDRLVKLAFEPLEASWPASRPFRPTYVTMTVLTPEVFRFVGTDGARRRRFFGLTPVSTTPVNARFVMHYNEVYKERITRTVSPNSSYDAFYLLAYATYALGDKPVTGTSLSAAVSRLVPPGKPVEVGPTRIFEAFSALRGGGNIDLTGAMSKLDFDLATGESPVDHALLCVNVDEGKRAFDSVESGLVYVASTGKLEGTMRCP